VGCGGGSRCPCGGGGATAWSWFNGSVVIPQAPPGFSSQVFCDIGPPTAEIDGPVLDFFAPFYNLGYAHAKGTHIATVDAAKQAGSGDSPGFYYQVSLILGRVGDQQGIAIASGELLQNDGVRGWVSATAAAYLPTPGYSDITLTMRSNDTTGPVTIDYSIYVQKVT